MLSPEQASPGDLSQGRTARPQFR